MRRLFLLTIIAMSLLLVGESFAASSQVYDKRSIGFGTLTDGKYCIWDSATKKVICNTSAVFTGTESTTGSAGSLLSPASELTIASDAITVTGGAHTVDTQEDAASDDLVTINGGADGKVVFLRAAHTDRTVVLKETGNIVLTHGTTLTLDSTGRWVMLYYDGNLSKWVCDALTDTLSLSSIAGAAITPAEVDGHTTSTYLTAAQVSNTVIHNYGQAASDVFLIAPAAAAGYSALFNVVTAQSNHWCFEAAASDKIYLIAAAGTVTAGDDGAAVCMMAAQIGQSFACWTFKSGASTYDWMCKAISIGTSTFEAHASSE